MDFSSSRGVSIRFGGARAMWVLLTFDLPVTTPEYRRDYVRFVKNLERSGFFRLQWSVFARPCPSDEQAKRHAAEVEDYAPPEGEVRVMLLTDLQFSRQRIILGKTRPEPELMPRQLELF